MIYKSNLLGRFMKFRGLSNKSLEELRDICQPGASTEPFVPRMFRKVSIFLTILFLYLGITPTAVTFMRFVVGVFGIVLICLGQYWLTVTGLFIFTFSLLLDLNDGEVFRYRTWKTGKKEGILVGHFLDRAFDYAYRPLLLLAAGIGSWILTGYVFYLFLGLIGSFFISMNILIQLWVIDSLVYRQEFNYLKSSSKKGRSENIPKFDWIYELFRINNPLTLYFWFGIFGYLHFFLIIYTPLLFLFFVKTFFTQYKQIRELDEEIYDRIYGKRKKN